MEICPKAKEMVKVIFQITKKLKYLQTWLNLAKSRHAGLPLKYVFLFYFRSDSNIGISFDHHRGSNEKLFQMFLGEKSTVKCNNFQF